MKIKQIKFFWEWTDFGIVFRIYKNLAEFADYQISLDIQLLWLNIWILLFKKIKDENKKAV